MTAGYSDTTLAKKLGIKPGHTYVALNAPATVLQEIAASMSQARVLTALTPEPDLIHLFVERKEMLEAEFPKLKEELPFHAALWISWPKRSAFMQTDLTENVVREIGLRCGLVDVKVCAVDDTWSGLKFVYRLQDRQ